MNMAYLILGGGRGSDRALFQALTIYYVPLGFPGVSVVTNLPAMQEPWARSLGLEDPLEAGMATDSSVLAWRIPWTEEPGGLQFMGVAKNTRQNWVDLAGVRVHTHTHTPLNPMLQVLHHLLWTYLFHFTEDDSLR